MKQNQQMIFGAKLFIIKFIITHVIKYREFLSIIKIKKYKKKFWQRCSNERHLAKTKLFPN